MWPMGLLFPKDSKFSQQHFRKKTVLYLDLWYYSVESKGVVFRKSVRLALLTDNLPRIKCTIGFLTCLQTTAHFRDAKIHDLNLALTRDILYN